MIEALFSQPNYAAAKKVLDAAELRHEAIARNLANVETPQYKRVDLAPTFEGELRKAVSSRDTTQIQGVRPSIVTDLAAVASGRDGNSVQLEKELLELSENSIHHQLGTQMVTGQMQRLRLAITGRPA